VQSLLIAQPIKRILRALRPNRKTTSIPTPSIAVSQPTGTCPDDMDRFQLVDGFEDAQLWEKAIHRAFEDAEHDATLAEVLRSAFLERDIAASFRRFQDSAAPKAVSTLLQRLGVSLDCPIVDVGCGRGHLAFALHNLGHTNVTAMDPNGEWLGQAICGRELTTPSV
jgi:hypothetical protein